MVLAYAPTAAMIATINEMINFLITKAIPAHCDEADAVAAVAASSTPSLALMGNDKKN